MNQPPKKRRRFSFSLRTLFVFMLALCLLFGFIGMRLQRAREQQVFLRELREAGWEYKFADGNYLHDTPEFWVLLIDRNYLDRIEGVDYRDDMIGEDDGGCGLNITKLLELKNLHVLSVFSTQVSDLSPLAELNNLQSLNIGNTQASELSPLAELENLEYLNLYNTQVSDLIPLAELENLELLFLENTQVSDLTPLADLKNLEYLYLSNTQVTDITPLVELKNLKWLNVSSTHVSNLAPLAELKNLEWLNVSNTQVTDQQIQQLQKALPNCEIVR